MTDAGHIPVLSEQTLALLDPQPGLTVLDATLGRGGHAELILPRIAGGRFLGLDLDPGNLDYAQSRLQPLAAEHDVELSLHHQSFVAAEKAMADAGVQAVDRLLADLGFSSNQMGDPQRGLSFAEPGPLDMRLDPTAAVTAEDLVNTLGEKDLADLIYGLGEERLSRRIARKIVETRGERPITTTEQLAQLVRSAYGPAGRKIRIHPATRTFMALRIAVNDELGSLERLLEQLPQWLAEGGRAAIISFHSLEDRRVKRAFLDLAQTQGWHRLTRKPLTASEDERGKNPRSRSAKLRAIERPA